MEDFFLEQMTTPLGTLLIVADQQQHLCAIEWQDYEPRMMKLLALHYPHHRLRLQSGRHPGHLTESLQRYFAGECHTIDALVTRAGGTPFQRLVWQALRSIPCGQTLSYGELAARLGRPTAARAVGMANGSNPISIVVPCHRVIGANGALTGYAGGVERKRWLLAHEQAAICNRESNSVNGTSS